MVELVERLEALTGAFLERMDEAEDEDFHQFIEAREEIVEALRLQPDDRQLTEALKPRVQALLRYDRIIVARMEDIKEEASMGMKKFDQARVQKSAYESVYAAESAFVDKRK